MIGLSSQWRRRWWLSPSKPTVLFTAMLLAAVMAGCVGRNETEIEKARARTDQARYESQAAQAQALALQAQASAAAAEAQARADAQTAMAQANAQVRVVEAQEETQRETAWLSILPWLALITILCGGAAVSAWLVLWFRGKAHLVTVQAQAQTAMMLPPPPQWPALPAQPSPVVALLPGPVARAAERTGLTPRPAAGGIWLLVDAQGEEVYRVRPGG